jgi:ankyrin repeat protein
MAELLLAKKANVNAKTKSGETPLHYAALHGFKDVVSLLVAARADVNAKSGDGETPLHLAAQYGDKDVVKLLMTSKIDVNAKDSDSQTALHDAAITGHKDVVELLVANRADVNAKDKNGETPLDCAVKYARADVAAFLRQHGGRNAIGAQPNAASKPKDVGSKDAYEVALFPEAYGFEKKAEMIDGTVVGREAYIGNQRMIIGVNKQWVKHNPGGRDMWLTVHFEQGKPAVAAWGGF